MYQNHFQGYEKGVEENWAVLKQSNIPNLKPSKTYTSCYHDYLVNCHITSKQRDHAKHNIK